MERVYKGALYQGDGYRNRNTGKQGADTALTGAAPYFVMEKGALTKNDISLTVLRPDRAFPRLKYRFIHFEIISSFISSCFLIKIIPEILENVKTIGYSSLTEELLFQEKQGVYLAWNELSDQRLIHALLLLNEEERRLIYQHVFEEKSFKEMEYLNGLPETRVKSIYYYSIRKIRKWMGVNKNDL